MLRDGICKQKGSGVVFHEATSGLCECNFYTVVCCGSHGWVTDAAFVLNFSRAKSSALSGNFTADFTTLGLRLLGSAAEMMQVICSSQVPACRGGRMQNNTKVASSAPVVYSVWLALRILGAYFTVFRTALWFLSQCIGESLFLFPWHLRVMGRCQRMGSPASQLRPLAKQCCEQQHHWSPLELAALPSLKVFERRWDWR